MAGEKPRPRDRIEISILVLLTVLAAAPIFAGRYLPFFDYPAHLAVPAALRHRADPATGVSKLWTLDLRLVPNSLHYALTYLGSFVMPLEMASRLFVAPWRSHRPPQPPRAVNVGAGSCVGLSGLSRKGMHGKTVGGRFVCLDRRRRLAGQGVRAGAA